MLAMLTHSPGGSLCDVILGHILLGTLCNPPALPPSQQKTSSNRSVGGKTCPGDSRNISGTRKCPQPDRHSLSPRGLSTPPPRLQHAQVIMDGETVGRWILEVGNRLFEEAGPNCAVVRTTVFYGWENMGAQATWDPWCTRLFGSEFELGLNINQCRD